MKNIFLKTFRTIFPSKNPQDIFKQYGIPLNINLHIELTQDGWFCASSPELPGLVTQAASKQELIEMVNDAILTYYNVPVRDADIIFETLAWNNETIRYEGKLHAKFA